MAYLPDTLKRIVELGGNIIIEESGYLPQTLIEVVTIAKRTGAHVTIASSKYLPNTLEQLVSIGGSNLTIKVS